MNLADRKFLFRQKLAHIPEGRKGKRKRMVILSAHISPERKGKGRKDVFPR